MLTRAEIRREVEKSFSTYTPEELFSSLSFQEMLQATVTSVCRSLGRVPKIKTLCNPKNSLSAQTDGMVIKQNTLNSNIACLDTSWKMYVSNIGHTVHETGHVLFTDFKNLNPMREHWHRGLFRFEPNIEGYEGKKVCDDLIFIMNDKPNLRQVYVNAMLAVVNVIEDAYIERRLYMNFDGLATAGLKLVNDTMYAKSLTIEEYIDRAISCNMMYIHVAINILLAKLVCGKKLKSKSLNEEQTEILNTINEVLDEKDTKAIIKKLLNEQDGYMRSILFNRLFVKLFPLAKPLNKTKNSDSGNGSKSSESSKSDGKGEGNGSSSSDDKSNQDQDQDLSYKDRNQMISETEKLVEDSMMSAEPEGNTSGIKQDDISNDEVDEKKDNASRLSNSQSSMESELQRAIKQAVEDKVLKSLENKHTENLKEEARLIKDSVKKETGTCKFNGYRIERPLPTEGYDEIFAEVSRVSSNLARKITNILKERQVDSVESGFLMGQRFNAKDVVNRDGKYFSRQIVPDGQPDLTIGVLIDESGSMYGSKIKNARKNAILLEDTLRRLAIPHVIYGHTEFGNICYMNDYVDYDTVDAKDKYRLVGVSAVSGNIDGAAITYIAEKILKRPEKDKILIVISDGIPAGVSFYHDNYNDDTRLAINKYRKKGVKIFGAIIDDYDRVAKIYGEYSFDCRDEEKLQANLIKLIKKYILK